MYEKIVVNLIIVNIEASIAFKVGVKQGCRTAPLIFLFLMMEFAETIEYKWTDLGLSKYHFLRKVNAQRSTKKVVRHRLGNFTPGTLFHLFFLLYVYEVTFVF